MAEEIETNPEEAKAREFGWVPQEEWVEQGKSSDDWVDAQTFNIRGRFIGDLKERDREIKELKSRVDSFNSLLTEQVKATREAALREAEKKHARAVEEGDTEGAKEALEEVKTIQSQPVSRSNPLEDFFSQHPEYMEDKALYREFKETDEWLAIKNRSKLDSDEKVMAHLQAVHEELTRKAPAPTTESTGGRTVNSKKSKKLTRSDLPEYLQTTHDMFVNQGVMTSEEYIKGLQEAGEI